MTPAERPRAPAAASSKTRATRREAMLARRHRTMLVGATLMAAVVLGAWFPMSDLLHQHEQLAAATTELHHLDQANHALKSKAAQLETPAAIARIAQQQYELVAPGDEAYQVLPPSGAGNGSVTGTTGTAAGTADSPSTPNGARTPDGRSSSSRVTAASATRPTTAGFLSRVLQSLEFWR